MIQRLKYNLTLPIAVLSLPLLLLDIGWYRLGIYLVPILTSLLLENDFELKAKLPIDQIISAFILILSILSLLGYLLGFWGSILTMILILMSGFGFIPSESLKDRIAISSAIGVVLASSIAFIYIILNNSKLFLIIPIFALISSIYSLAKEKADSKEIKIDSYLMILLILVFFFTLELAAVTPFMFKFIPNDLLTHQSYARLLVDAPSSYATWSYIGFHSLMSSIYALASPNAFSLMFSTVILNFLSLYLVYVAFSKMEHRKESLAIWGLLTGFGWLAFLLYKDGFSGLELADKASYKSLTWSQPIFFWGLPLTLAIGLLAFLLYLDIYWEGERKKKLVYIAMGVLSAFLVHVAEALVFVAYLTIAALLLGRRKVSSIASLSAAIVLSALYYCPGIYTGSGPSTSIYLLLASFIALALNELRDRYISELIGKFFSLLRRWDREIVDLLLALYMTGLVVWFIHLGEVDVEAIYNLGQVPWFFYPVLLGIAGILAITSLRSEFKPEFALLILVSIAMGRFVTYYKLAGGTISYWEYRFPFYAALGISALGSFYVGKVIKAKIGTDKKYGLFLAILLLSGYATTAVSFQTWYQLSTMDVRALSEVDYGFASNNTFFRENPKIPALLLTSYSTSLSNVLSPPIKIKSIAPWLPYGPEIPLYSLAMLSPSTNEVALLWTLADLGYLEKVNASFPYIKRFLGPAESYPSLTVVNLSSPPIPNAKLAVILPADTYLRRRALVAYELLRKELPVHTTYLSDDPLAPKGIYIGPPSSNISVNEKIPSSPYDLRWLYIWGNFSNGLKVNGGRGFAITTYELNDGSYELKACGQMRGYVALIYDYKNLKNYRIAQLYLDRDALILRTVKNGKVSSEKPIIVPASKECADLTISLREGKLQLVVNGKLISPPSIEKLGVLGFETGNFTGEIRGRISGTHSVVWNPPEGSTLLLITGNGSLAKSVDLGMVNLTKAKSSFKPIKLSLESGKERIERAKYVASSLNASGTIYVEGRPIWIQVGEIKRYLNVTHIKIRAKGISFRYGEGFYVDLNLRQPSIENVSEAVIRFRTPVEIKVKGELKLEGHPFVRYVSKTESIEAKEANLSIMMADKVILLDKLEYKRALGPAHATPYKSFDESKYLLEAVIGLIVLFFIIYYVDRRYVTGYIPRRKSGRERRKKEKEGRGKRRKR